jgi:hypothetical protein
MEHDEAIRSHAAERYLARELSPEDHAAFEEHFFDCPECAEEVRFEATFAANVRAVMREPARAAQPMPASPQPSLWMRWRDWWRLRPALAVSYAGNLVLAAGLAVVLLTGTRQADQPRFSQVYFAPGPAHGVEDVHSLAAGDTYYIVRFLAPNQKSPSYYYEILDAAGQRESSGSLPAPAGQEENLYLQIPVKGLPGGTHTLEVRAGQQGGEVVSRSRFKTSS